MKELNLTFRPYENMEVTMTHQNFGVSFLCVLRGKQKDIELVFNGLYNLCATNGELEYVNYDNSMAIFWTSKKALRRFFSNKYELSHDFSTPDKASKYADARMLELRKCPEYFLNYRIKDNVTCVEPYSTGNICAEKPDNDLKDAILNYAFENREEV